MAEFFVFLSVAMGILVLSATGYYIYKDGFIHWEFLGKGGAVAVFFFVFSKIYKKMK